MAIKIVNKALDKYVECTLYGFVYDLRKVKVERSTQKELRELNVKRTHSKQNKRSRNKR